ncbi:PMD domain-containing protein [Cephalotus follicularis]|uniref:PMD domain-containing protein n=1 Tax=Cephalotus follicularis TaxID=3775 RepID=A0A1Q3BKW8_CEPFO|nr:PMD domain-containing protein [Cephalotus follicularis]
MEEPICTLVEEREEAMISFGGDSQPVLRKAHFLTPNVTSTDGHVINNLAVSISSLPPTFEPKNWPIKVKFEGWLKPLSKWKTWVDCLSLKYQSVWKQAEKWNPETNTLVFPWAEASITLEDVLILGGYSVWGSPVTCLVESRELMEIEEELVKARTELGRTPANKASQWGWLTKFAGSGSKIEHEAFLSLWLARFVLKKSTLITRQVFPLAIHLARGTRIALAPAVLARIYKDLRLLKELIVASTEFDSCENDDYVLEVTLWSPFYLVQLWAWERLQDLQPRPNLINFGDGRGARWNRVKSVNVKNVRVALNSAGESFHWRPYATVIKNWQFPKFYKEKEEWILVESGIDEEIMSFVLCLRVSELVGIGCIEQYLPNRVAMQFGLDQDLPGHVARRNQTPEIAWSNYLRPFGNTKLYVPSRFFESDVTVRYLEWRNQSLSVQQDVITDVIKCAFRKNRCLRKPSKKVSLGSRGMWADNEVDASPIFANQVVVKDFVLEKKRSIAEISKSCEKHDSLATKQVNNGECYAYAGQAESSSTSAASNRILTDNSEIIRVGHNISQNKAVVGGSTGAMENPDVNRAGNSVSTVGNMNGNEEESNTYMCEIPGLELEAKIAKLERVVAELKAARFGIYQN